MKKNRTVNLLNGETTDYKDLTDSKTQEKITKHMNDINDKITEDDLKNIRTDMYDELLRNENEVVSSGTGKNELTQEEKNKEEEAKESRKINSAWNVIGET